MSESSEPLVAGLFHVAVKTNDLAATVAFYTRVLGLREVPRPDFGYPGAWLGVALPGGPGRKRTHNTVGDTSSSHGWNRS